jgi:hypothetical protein
MLQITVKREREREREVIDSRKEEREGRKSVKKTCLGKFFWFQTFISVRRYLQLLA